MKKRRILYEVKKRAFSFPHQEKLFALLEEHLDQITFVKDYIGARDVLYFSEHQEKKIFSDKLFLSLGVPLKDGMDYVRQETLFRNRMLNQPLAILKSLQNFFQQEGAMLSVCIHFQESTITELEKLAIQYAVSEGKIANIFEGMRKIRKFPSWYSAAAVMPEEVVANMPELSPEEKEAAKKEGLRIMQEVKKELDRLLEKKKWEEHETEEAKRLSRIYRKMQDLVG